MDGRIQVKQSPANYAYPAKANNTLKPQPISIGAIIEVMRTNGNTALKPFFSDFKPAIIATGNQITARKIAKTPDNLVKTEKLPL
jgi:hypothetical protein